MLIFALFTLSSITLSISSALYFVAQLSSSIVAPGDMESSQTIS